MKIKGLTKANIAKLGIELAPQLDFSDDGNNFRGFMYKDMPLSQCRANGECFLSIRVDYLENNFIWEEWRDAGGEELSDKFNGVTEFDTEDLLNTLEEVIKLREELNSKYTAPSERDWERLEERIHNEVLAAQSFLDEAKKTIAWWELSKYQFNHITDAIKSMTNRIEWYTIDKIKGCSVAHQRREIKRLETSNDILGVNWYKDTIQEWKEK